MTRKLLIPAVALLALAGAAAYWASTQVDDSAEAGVEVIRWGNVTVSVPDGSGVSVARYIALPEENPPDGGLVIRLFRGESQALIDADDGRILWTQIAASDAAVVEPVLASLGLDTAAPAKEASWPYSTVPPAREKIQMGSVLFWEPDAPSGITWYPSYEDSDTQPGLHIVITNGRSTRSVYGATGEVDASSDNLAPQDIEAFERWTDAVEVVGP